MSAPLDLAAVHVPHTSLHDRWRHWLQRLYASETLYRWSLSNPFTRHITRQRTRQLFDLMAGFVHSQVLLACVRLGVFEALREAPDTVAALARRSGVPEPEMQRLLLSAVSLGLLEHRSAGRLGLGPLGVPLTTHPGIAQMVEHNQLLYQDLQDPLAFLRQGQQASSARHAQPGDMARYWPYAHGDLAAVQRPEASEQVARYSGLMAESQGFVVHEILSSYFFDEHRCVLDVGAGQGRFVTALARHAPHLQLQMFDLPPVLAQARQRIEQAGLAARVQLHPGSFIDDPLPTGADLITLVRVAHDHPDAVVRLILQKAFAALPPGGVLLIAEPMAQAADAPTQHQADAYYHFYLMAMGAGRLRSVQEMTALLREAGFTAIEQVPNAMPIHGQMVLGRKPKG
ncbi:MAG: methyltransferase [Limnohabitans sp.]